MTETKNTVIFTLIFIGLTVAFSSAARAEPYCMKDMCYESDAELVAEKSFDGNVPSKVFLFRGETLSFLDLSLLRSGVGRNTTEALLSAYGEGLVTGEGGKIVSGDNASVDIGENCVEIEALFGALRFCYRLCGEWSNDKKILRIVTTSESLSSE